MGENASRKSWQSLEEVVRSRRTIQTFEPGWVDKQILYKSLELALWAPNHHMTMPVRFVEIGAQAREFLVDAVVRLKVQGSDVSSSVKQVYAAPWLSPAHLIAVVQKVDSNSDRAKEDYAFIAAGLQNASLYLWSEGVGSKWSTAKVARSPEVCQRLNVDSSIEQIVGIFMVGRFIGVPPAPPRPSLSERLTLTD